MSMLSKHVKACLCFECASITSDSPNLLDQQVAHVSTFETVVIETPVGKEKSKKFIYRTRIGSRVTP